MSQRTWAGVLAVPLVLGLWLAALFMPLPYVTYSPGITVDVLASDGDVPRIEVTGAETFAPEGNLMLTTVYVTRPDSSINIFEVLEAWFDADDAVYPRDVVYPPGSNNDDYEEQSAFEMASSQEVATAVALKAAGHEVTEVVKVAMVSEDMPAEGLLKEGDVLVSINGTEISTPQDAVTAVGASAKGEAVEFVVLRKGKRTVIDVTPRMVEGSPKVGIVPTGAYDSEVDVQLNVNPIIGGPSAGLVFALGVYDTLTKGNLTGGAQVAGTGTLAADGTVGPIGGIQQKIAASRDQGAGIFLVPAANCDEALGADNQDMRLVRVETFDDALTSVETWAKDNNAELNTCGRNAEK